MLSKKKKSWTEAESDIIKTFDFTRRIAVHPSARVYEGDSVFVMSGSCSTERMGCNKSHCKWFVRIADEKAPEEAIACPVLSFYTFI